MSFDYYQILQVNPAATKAEIKTSYRRLAKLFHPDKNAGAEDKFKIIKEAYETLIDDVRRSKYDVKRNYEIAVSQLKKTEPKKKQKTYTFTEPELKHRSYYQEHYKPKTKSYVKQTSKSANTNYKELTYILISIPAAITLLLLLVNLYQKPEKKIIPIENRTKIVEAEIKTAESPYKDFFEKEIYDTISEPYIKIKNPTDNDAIIFLKNDKATIIRHYFIEHNYQLFMEGIPKGTYTLYYYTGKGFTYKQNIVGNLAGNFKEIMNVDSFAGKIKIIPAKQDSFLFSIPKKESGALDTSLLKRIFSVK